MIDDEPLKNLIFYSNPIPEMEDDEDDIDRDEMIAVFKCDCLNILESIGEENFRPIYENSIISVRSYYIDDQIDFCYQIFEKINEVYEFEFIRKIEIGEEDVENVYKFLEFIEFDNVDFLEELLEGYAMDIRKIDPQEFILNHWKDLQTHLLTMNLGEFISDFLRTNTKDNIVNFLSKAIENSKTELTIRLLQ